MKKTRLQQMQEQALRCLGDEQGKRVADSMEREYSALCQAYDKQFEAMEHHNHNNIFPVVSAVRAMQAEGMERKKAVQLAQDMFLELMEQPAQMIRNLLKVPGLYRLMPWIWKTMMPKMFSEDNGFRFRFYPTDSKRVKFDMLECPYYRICKELDCLDLAGVFCTTDDVCYGHMHPKLLWNRTQTIARGAKLCDFDVIVDH